MTTRNDRRGFALPMALLVIALLTVAVAAGFTVLSAEHRVNDDAKAQLQALTVAQTGLTKYLRNPGLAGPAPLAGDSQHVTMPNGYADVVLYVVRTPPSGSTQPPVYVVRSRGVYTGAGRTPLSTRTVSQFAVWQNGTVNSTAMWTSLAGIDKNGASGRLTGKDSLSACPNPGATIGGISVPNDASGTPLYAQQGGGQIVPDGSPPVTKLGQVGQQQGQGAQTKVKVDWGVIVNQGGARAEVILPANSNSWPAQVATRFASRLPQDTSWYPTIFVNGDFTMPSGGGRGVLIVSGKLTLGGNGAPWSGVILAGKNIESNGGDHVEGMVLSGLNLKLAPNDPLYPRGGVPRDIINGNNDFIYNSCLVGSAMQRFGGLQTYPNTWSDNWPSW